MSLGAKLPSATFWRLPEIVLKKGGGFVLFFSLKDKESVLREYFREMTLQGI